MSDRDIQRLKQIVSEEDKPYKNEEALRLALHEDHLDLNQTEAAEKIFDCSAATISNWYRKLDIEEDEESGEVQNNGEECVRCGRAVTPDNPQNGMCNECMDYVRMKDSNTTWNMEFPDEVVNA